MVRMLWTTTTWLEGRLATASFVVALSLGGLSVFSGAYGEGVDQLAWALLVVAATITFGGLLSLKGLSRRQMLAVGLLLTGSVFTKQTTLVPCLLVSSLTPARLIFVESRQIRTWRKMLRSATVLLTFAGTSALLGMVLQIASHGYAFDLMVEGQLRYVRVNSLRQQADLSLRSLAVPLVALIVLVLCVAWSLFANSGRRRRLHIFVATAAIVVAVSPIPTAVLAEAKLGGGPNQLTGPVWTLTLGCAALLLILRPSARQLAASAVACGVLVLSFGPLSDIAVEHELFPPKLYQPASWSSIDPFLLAAVNKGGLVYDVAYPSLSVSPSAPRFPMSDMLDLLAAGYTPRWVIRNLLAGRYALVRPYDEYPFLYSTFTDYTSNFGQYDESFLWKIDLLVRMGYEPVKDPVSGFIYYRPTPRLKRLGWFAGCFGPFQAQHAGVDVRLRGAGGLLCIGQGGLDLSEAPAPITELVMTLSEATGEATVRFTTTPHTLRVTPLDDRDRPLSFSSDVNGSRSAISECLAHDGTITALTLRAVHARSGLRCTSGGAGQVLDVPTAGDRSTAHVSVEVATIDSPTFVASSTTGNAVPFMPLDPTPTDIGRL